MNAPEMPGAFILEVHAVARGFAVRLGRRVLGLLASPPRKERCWEFRCVTLSFRRMRPVCTETLSELMT